MCIYSVRFKSESNKDKDNAMKIIDHFIQAVKKEISKRVHEDNTLTPLDDSHIKKTPQECIWELISDKQTYLEFPKNYLAKKIIDSQTQDEIEIYITQRFYSVDGC